jgi:hypothetical protein
VPFHDALHCLDTCARQHTLALCLLGGGGFLLLELGQFFQDFGRVPRNATFHVDKDPTQIALRINQVRLAIAKGAKAGNGKCGSVCLAHSTTYLLEWRMDIISPTIFKTRPLLLSMLHHAV